MNTQGLSLVEPEKTTGKKIKCVIWDLDNTIWKGVLLEDGKVILREEVREIITTLDERGILQSIASKNNNADAMEKLKEFGLDEYFIYPEINWNAKSFSVKRIVENINIGMDTIAFVDDQEFERDEVKSSQPQVMCIDSNDLSGFLNIPELNPKFITSDSKIRRKMYQSDIERNKVEEEFQGTQEEFLASLNMELTISPVGDEDLKRAEELTVRTHQLNTTGYTYSYEELDMLRNSNRHKLLIAGLTDKYGTYGKIGLVLLECDEKTWSIKLLLMSCRVMSRGVGSVIINYIMGLAKEAGVNLKAEFVSNDRNRMMYITYKFAGFKEVDKKDNVDILENDLSRIQPMPDYMKINIK